MTAGVPQTGEDVDVDVVVVGAGLTGLIAARELAAGGIRTIVLEANDRVGGRTFSRGGDCTVDDLGAEFVHPVAHAAVVAEAARYDLELAPVPDSGRSWYERDGTVRAARDVSGFTSLFAELDGAASRLDQDVLWTDDWRDLDISWRDFLRQLDAPLDVIEEFEAWSFGLTGAWPHEVSALAVLRDLRQFGGTAIAFERECRFVNGAQSLADAVAGELGDVVRLGAAVERIAESEHTVTTSVAGGSIRAFAALVTVPANALARIVFEGRAGAPDGAVPHAGKATKVWFDTTGDVEDDLLRADPPTVAFAGRVPRRACIISIGEVTTEDVLSSMRSIGTEPADGSRTSHDWCSDPVAAGTWMSPRPGQLSMLAELARRTGRVRFGGADLTPIWPGWMEGAIHAGRRLAATATDLVPT